MKSVSFVFTLLRAIETLAKTELNSAGQLDLPPSIFFDTSIDYFDMDRVGGLSSHLFRKFHTQVAESLAIPDYAVSDGAASQRGPGPAQTTFGVTFLGGGGQQQHQLAAVITGTPR